MIRTARTAAVWIALTGISALALTACGSTGERSAPRTAQTARRAAAVSAASPGALGPGWVFWTQSKHGHEKEPGTIGRANLYGSHPDGHVVAGGSGPAGIAVQGDYIYWANYGGGTIARANINGSEVNERFIAGANYPIGVAVNATHIYWTNAASYESDSGTVGRANLNGSGVEQHLIATGEDPVGLAVDTEHIYWTDRYHNSEYSTRGYAIGRANLDGSAVNKRFIDVSNRPDGLALDGPYLYWSNVGEHAVGRANINGVETAQLCLQITNVPLVNVPEGLAAAGQRIYWTNYPADTIASAHVDGSDPDARVIAVDGVPGAIAVAAGEADTPPSASGACHGSSPPLLLGPAGRGGLYVAGFGEVAPAVISNGGFSISATIRQIHWRSWGQPEAHGRGLNPLFLPGGGYYPKPALIELRASRIGRCTPAGRLVYTRFATREQVKPGGALGPWYTSNICLELPEF